MEIERIVKITLYVSILVFILTAFKKDELPPKTAVLKQLYQEPKQTRTSAPAFAQQAQGIKYNIVPVYDYELYGMVVSYHHSNVFWDYEHKANKDFINTADICVIWGKNIETEIYKRMRFCNGSWTCYPEFTTGTKQDVFLNYRSNCLSNNHLLAQNDTVNRQIMSAQKGDQIFIKGLLVDYTQHEWRSPRASSTTRTDNGCEVIFVKEFKILKKANYFWRLMHDFTKCLIPVCILFFVVNFFRYVLREN